MNMLGENNYLALSEIIGIANITEAANGIEAHSVGFEVAIFDGNGEYLGVVKPADTGDYAFFPGVEVTRL